MADALDVRDGRRRTVGGLPCRAARRWRAAGHRRRRRLRPVGDLRVRGRRHRPPGPAGGGRPGGPQRAVPPRHAVDELREERVPRVVSRPDGVDPHVPGRRQGPCRARARRRRRGMDRAPLLESTDMVLCPAVCHPLYPTQSGTLPEGGRVVEVYGYCFRHEPSTDPFRMQAFRQHDYVFLGSPEGARAHRDRWIERGLDVLSGLGLTVESVIANDPFFGRPGRMLAANQRSEELKYEIVAPVFAEGPPDGHLVVQLPSGPLLPTVRHRHGGRADRPHVLLRLRRRPDHPRPARPPRHRPGRLARRRPGRAVAVAPGRPGERGDDGRAPRR